MLLEDIIKKSGFSLIDEKFSEAKAVFDQALRHSARNVKDTIFDEKRPNEAANIKDWRSKNRRNLSSDIPDRFMKDLVTAVSNTGYKVTGLSERLSEFLDEKRIKVLGNTYNVEDYVTNVIANESRLDPNAYLVLFPLPTRDVPTPNDQTELDKIDIDFKIVPYSQIIKLKGDLNNHLFGWKEVRPTKDKEGVVRDKVYYIISDIENWYIVDIVDKKANITLWYKHNIGKIPAVIIPGEATKADKTLYNETFLKSMYNFLDEFMTSFDDDKVSRAKASFPILAMPEVACNTCMGERIVNGVTCKSCNGSGKNRTPGPADTFIIPTDKSGLSGGSAMEPKFITPDSGILDHSWKIVWDLWDKGANTQGVDSLINTSESGEAMKQRLEKNKQATNYVYKKLCAFYQDLLIILEGYVEPTESLRTEPKVDTSVTIQTYNIDLLKINYVDATPIEKKDTLLDYLRVKYKNDLVKLKKYEVLATYYPVSIIPEPEIVSKIAMEIYSTDDIKAAIDAGNKLDLLLDNPNNLEKSTLELYNLIK